MPISTADCKELLVRDDYLYAAGAKDGKGWKRLSKRKTPLGVERVFQHACGVYARVVENQGQLYIAASAVSEAELDDTLNQRSAPAKHTPSDSMVQNVSSQASWCWPRLASKTERSRAASLVNALYIAFCEDDEDTHASLEQAVRDFEPVAMANQYTFAICHGSEYTMAVITPTHYWETEGYCYDQPSPIEHLLLPHSEDINDCGSWLIPGFEDNPVALAAYLLEQGFQWDEDFQKLIDGSSESPTLPLLGQLVKARAIE